MILAKYIQQQTGSSRSEVHSINEISQNDSSSVCTLPEALHFSMETTSLQCIHSIHPLRDISFIANALPNAI